VPLVLTPMQVWCQVKSCLASTACTFSSHHPPHSDAAS
jgi:hypothetical protein